jgi:hypothetical protein
MLDERLNGSWIWKNELEPNQKSFKIGRTAQHSSELSHFTAVGGDALMLRAGIKQIHVPNEGK